ncbi:protein bark beetle-like [Penaeus japonicus]|uniref:protein bark beetle-like n=1 Tax=Penaeus japonicus TaxID=27405 RepID=UPI001C714970|nr:protein bark beetle-like [Penaeus japonicus]
MVWTRRGSVVVMWCAVVSVVTVLLVTTPSAEAFGGVIASNVVYDVSGSPYVITQDITIEDGGVLTIEPGVTVQFDPGVGMTVKGVLRAEGTPTNRIKLTSSFPPTAPLSDPGLRLVDGPTPLQGRLQIFYKDKWRSICSNSRK